MKTARVGWLCPILLLLPHAAAQQPYLNLDFETATRGMPWGWGYGGNGYEFALDTSVAYSGAQSFRIRYVNAQQLGSSVATSLPLEVVRGKHLRFTGYMKTDSITQGGAGLWLRVDGTSAMISIDNSPAGVTNRTTAWQPYVIDRDVSPDAAAVIAGGFQFGNGTAWFDKFALEIDGVPLAQGPPPNIGEPAAEQLNWVKQTANPFVTPNAGNGLDDLWPVKGMVGNASIVGLGEGTHGTSEFFRMKHRLLEYLATEMGFTIFSIEANMPEAYLVNDYVLNGNGDPKKLLQGMYFWTWNTQEVLDMILWMRQFNLSGKGRIQFTGFDMQVGSVAASNVRNFVSQADPAYYQTANSALTLAAIVQANYLNGVSQSAGTVQPAVDAVHAVWQYLTQHRDDYLANYSASDVDWAIQNAKIMEQATYIVIGGSLYRDQCMASNIDWILQQNPGAKIVLWAHDYHVSRTSGAMGSLIAANHGADYVVFGQIFHAGNYNAVNNGRLMANAAVPSFPGTVEYVLHSTGMPQFFLDTRSASPDDAGSSWLLGITQYRNIGAVAQDGFQFTYQLTKDYDVLIFFDQTTPSSLLPLN
jgi:erythromycin esterase